MLVKKLHPSPGPGSQVVAVAGAGVAGAGFMLFTVYKADSGFILQERTQRLTGANRVVCANLADLPAHINALIDRNKFGV